MKTHFHIENKEFVDYRKALPDIDDMLRLFPKHIPFLKLTAPTYSDKGGKN